MGPPPAAARVTHSTVTTTVSELEALKNRGVLTMGKPLSSGPKTVIVVGIARGGTSIFAGALSKLGVFMGERAAPPVFEDVRLASAFEAGNLDEAHAIVAEYNARHKLWAFKRPGVIPHLGDMHHVFREPVYLFVFRDLFSVASRNQISMRVDLLENMRASVKGYATVIDFIDTVRPRGVLVSCEKVLTDTRQVLDHLISYLDLRVSPTQRQAALDFVQPDPPQYLQSTRLHFMGSFDHATTEFVTGWALIRNHSTPARLIISVNGSAVGTTTASLPRPDVRSKGLHPTGECGFRFQFPADIQVGCGDEIAVQFQLGGDHLARSPRVVSG